MLTCVITPQRSDSILWIHVEYPTMRSYSTGDTRNLCNHKIKRNGTNIYAVNETPQWRGANFATSGTIEINIPVSFSTFDSPNTTSAVTYSVYAAIQASSQSAYIFDTHIGTGSSGDVRHAFILQEVSV